MPNSIFDANPLRDEQAAYAYVESKIWPNGRVCPHCGVVDRSGLLKGKSIRIGVYKCYVCRKPFTVKVGTIFEDSHVSLHVAASHRHLPLLLGPRNRSVAVKRSGRASAVIPKPSSVLPSGDDSTPDLPR